MAALHAEPERKWTVTELASAAAVSRSVLDQRFREVLGRSPIRYLTEWRMHLADDLLRTTDLKRIGGLAAHRLRVRRGVQPGLPARSWQFPGRVAGVAAADG
jgi:AraC-like DNA-binding protein